MPPELLTRTTPYPAAVKRASMASAVDRARSLPSFTISPTRGTDREARGCPSLWGSNQTAQLKLLQEAQVAGVEPANVVDAVAHHAEALDAQASGKAAPALWIEAHTGEHGGVDHAAAHHL